MGLLSRAVIIALLGLACYAVGYKRGALLERKEDMAIASVFCGGDGPISDMGQVNINCWITSDGDAVCPESPHLPIPKALQTGNDR